MKSNHWIFETLFTLIRWNYDLRISCMYSCNNGSFWTSAVQMLHESIQYYAWLLQDIVIDQFQKIHTKLWHSKISLCFMVFLSIVKGRCRMYKFEGQPELEYNHKYICLLDYTEVLCGNELYTWLVLLLFNCVVMHRCGRMRVRIVNFI